MAQDEIFATAQVLESGIQLPAQPDLLNKLNALLEADDVNIGQVAVLLGRDAAVTAMLFKLASSPMFGGRKAPDSIEAVINMLGLGVVADLVRGMLLRTTFAGGSPFSAWFWERCDDIAGLAGTLALRIKNARIAPSHARLAAMFMDCGVAILTQRHPAYVNVFNNPAAPGYAWPSAASLDTQMKSDHAVVGSLLGKHWKLPDHVCQAIREHHTTQLPANSVGKLIAILQLARYAYQHKGHAEDAEWPLHAAAVMETLDLTEHEVEDLVDDV